MKARLNTDLFRLNYITKNLCRIVAIVIVFAITPFSGYAQVKIDIKDIQKIHLIDAEGALGFSRVTEFDLLEENGQWIVNQTKQMYRATYARPAEKLYYDKENAIQQKFIKKTDPQVIQGFLSTIYTIKSNFSAQSFSINPQTMVHYAETDSMALRAARERPAEHSKLILNEAINPQHIKEAIDSLQHDWWTDDYPYCGIHIILKNNDTIKVGTYRQPSYMLPWLIGKTPTFDLNINKFFIAVMGDYKKSAKPRLDGSYLPGQIWEYCYRTYGDAAISKFIWRKQDPDFYEGLTTNFRIKDLRYRPWVQAKLITAGLPGNAIISLNASIDSTRYLNRLLNFRDSVKQYFKAGNFVFDHYKNTPATEIIFRWGTTGSIKWYNPNLRKRLDQFLKDNPIYNLKDIQRFMIDRNNHEESQWALLPDGTLILLVYFTPDVAGLKGNPLHAINTYRKECFVVFDREGNIISQ